MRLVSFFLTPVGRYLGLAIVTLALVLFVHFDPGTKPKVARAVYVGIGLFVFKHAIWFWPSKPKSEIECLRNDSTEPTLLDHDRSRSV